MKTAHEINILRNPSAEAVTALLARCGHAGLRGIEDYSGNVYVWPYDEATHMIAAGILNIPYDAASDFASSLTGKTFYVRSPDDWQKRERRRSEPDSFTTKCRNAHQND